MAAPKTKAEAAKLADRNGNFTFRGRDYHVDKSGNITVMNDKTVAARNADKVDRTLKGRQTRAAKVEKVGMKKSKAALKEVGVDKVLQSERAGNVGPAEARITEQLRREAFNIEPATTQSSLANSGNPSYRPPDPYAGTRWRGMTEARYQQLSPKDQAAFKKFLEEQVGRPMRDPGKKPRAATGKSIAKKAVAQVEKANKGLSVKELVAGQKRAAEVRAARGDKPKVENAAKPKPQAPKAPAKGKTPAADSKPSTTPSKPRNRAPKVEKPVSPRLEMKSEFSKIKRNIETSIRQGERKAASKASKAADASTKPTAPAAKKTTAPKPKAEKPKAPAAKKTTAPKAAAKKSAPSGRKTSPKAPARGLPGKTFEEKLKNFKGERVPASAKWVKAGSKVARAAAPAARVLGRFAGPAGLALTAAEAARLGTTAQGQREYVDMRRAIDMGMRGKDVKGRDLVRKGTMYTATADAKKEADTAKSKKLKQASAKAGDARAQAMNRAAYRYTVKKGPRPSGESYTPSKKQDSSGKGANRPSAPMTGRAVRVQRGGTMWDIAQKNKTTVSALYKANPELARRKAAGKTVIYRNTLVKIPGKK